MAGQPTVEVPRLHVANSSQGVLAFIIAKATFMGAGHELQGWIHLTDDEQDIFWRAAGDLLPKVLDAVATEGA